MYSRTLPLVDLYGSGAIRFLTLSDEEFLDDDFFSDVNDLFGNLKMGDNTDIDVAATANAAPYVFLSFLFQILLDVIRLSFLDDIHSSTLLHY
jgi:hypothetical protein